MAISNEHRPSLDAGLGLIFRLNDLWKNADENSINGDYEGWGNVLEAIWRNLSYKEPMVFETKGEKIKIVLSKKDLKGWEVLCKNVNIAKRNWEIAIRKNPRKARYYWSRRYHRLQLKDLFLRKKMFELNLYLKVTERNVTGSTFGELGQ